MWPYNVQATAALDISSSVCLAIKYQSPATHTHTQTTSLSVPKSGLRLGKGRLAVLCGPQKVGEKKQLFFFGGTFQPETDDGRNRNRHSPGQPRRAKLREGTLVTEQKVACVKGLGQSFRETRGSCKLEKEKGEKNHLSK